MRVLRTRGPSVVYLDFGFLGGKGSDGERKREKQQQQQQQRLETANDGASENEDTSKSVLTSHSVNNNDFRTSVISKRPRSDNDNENGQVKKRTKKQCSHEDCNKWALKGGVCWSHGANAEARSGAVMKDVQIILSTEGCVEGTGLRPNYATAMNAQIKLRKEECALSMGQRSNAAAVKGCTKHAYKQGFCNRHGIVVYTGKIMIQL